MSEPTYYTLSEVEHWLSISRDTLSRCAAAGLLRLDGDRKQRRVLAVTYVALKRRIEEGTTLWQLLNEAESAADQKPSDPQPTDVEVSTKTVKAAGGSSRRRKKESDSHESAIPTKPAPPWLRRIT